MSRIKIDFPQKLNEEFFGDNIREDVEIKYLPILLENCDVFIDVGANIGQYTYFSNKAMNNSLIYSIEANKELLPILKKNSAKWEKESNNSIKIINAVVSDKEDVIPFFVSANRTGSSIFNNKNPAKITEAESIKLDKFYEKGKNFLIKMDIEGAEYRALLGCEKFIKSTNTKFFIELHGWGDKELKKYPLDIANMFLANGYSIQRIGSHYNFERGTPINRVISYIINFPLLFLKFTYRKYIPFATPIVNKIVRLYLKAFNKKSI